MSLNEPLLFIDAERRPPPVLCPCCLAALSGLALLESELLSLEAVLMERRVILRRVDFRMDAVPADF